MKKDKIPKDEAQKDDYGNVILPEKKKETVIKKRKLKGRIALK